MFDLPNIGLPVSIFLIVYGAFMVFYLFYSLFNIYHLIRYGLYGFGLYFIVTLFAGGTILLVAGSFFLIAEHNWNHPITANEAFEFYNEDLFPGL